MGKTEMSKGENINENFLSDCSIISFLQQPCQTGIIIHTQQKRKLKLKVKWIA